MNDEEFLPLTRSTIHDLLEARRSGERETKHEEKRRSPRWSFPGQVELWIPREDAPRTHFLGVVHELNETGVGVRCGSRVDPDQVITVAIHQPEASFYGSATVRHCTPCSPGYLIGLEFVNG